MEENVLKYEVRKNIPWNEANEIADQIARRLEPFCEKIVVAGSIRRKKNFVNDIDIVLIPKKECEKLMRHYLWNNFFCTKFGDKIIEFIYNKIKVQLYLTDEQKFETILLIRTGSAAHNHKLALLAKIRGWKLKADGTGLIDSNNNIIANTEQSIIKKILGHYVPPEKR